jgi:hypothetical protein
MGFAAGSGDPSPEDFIAGGVGSIAIQIGQPEGMSVEHAQSIAATFHSRGLAVYVWSVPGQDDVDQVKQALQTFADGWIPQVEDDAQYDALLGELRDGVEEGLPRAVVTIFRGINVNDNRVATPERMSTLASNGITTAFVECYKLPPDPEHDHSDLPWMIDHAHGYGWPNAIPVIGLFSGVRFAEYDLTLLGRAWGFYLADGVNADDWPAMASAGN